MSVNNVSTTMEMPEQKGWSINKLYESEFTIPDLIKTLEVIDIFKRKYPNDENVVVFEDIVRDEICQMLGGNIEDTYGE